MKNNYDRYCIDKFLMEIKLFNRETHYWDIIHVYHNDIFSNYDFYFITKSYSKIKLPLYEITKYYYDEINYGYGKLIRKEVIRKKREKLLTSS